MSDPLKQLPSFSFGKTASSGNASNAFGQASSNTSQAPGSLFGSIANPSTTSSSGLFGGNTSTAPGNSLSGGGTPTTGQPAPSFGLGSTTSGSGNVFGGGSNSGSTGFDFGAANTNNSSNTGFGARKGSEGSQPATSGGMNSGFPAFSTPNKPPESSAPGQSTSIFGAASGTAPGGLFGNLGLNSTASSGQTVASTPAANNPFGSTTPAGPPPFGGNNAGSALNFNKPQEQKSNPFANLAAAKPSTQGTIISATPANPFSGLAQPLGGSSGSSKPLDSNNPSAAAPAPVTGLFSPPQNSVFAAQRSAQPEGGMFSNLNKPQGNGDGTSPAITTAQQNAGESVKSPGIFSGLGQTLGTNPTSQSTSTPLFSGSSQNAFANASKPSINFPSTSAQSGAPSTTTSASIAPSDLFGSQPPATGSSAPSAIASSGGIFSALGNGNDKTSKAPNQSTITSATAASAAPATTQASNLFGNLNNLAAPAPKSNMFAGPNMPATATTASQSAAKAPATGTAESTGNAKVSLGTSTSGPPPPAQSRLKNKSMDEIITRWASDLSKYQKEFQQEAEKAAGWDRMLVENSDKIQKLYGNTLEAERATTEVERQLTAVENDQRELELWLDHYEGEVDKMTSNQVGQGESVQGPDQERERT